MKAAYYEAVGGPEVIRYGDLPTPSPKPGEVRIKVSAAALNPIDTYIRAGTAPMDLPKPFIPGCDFAGTVDAIGEGVTRWRSGDRVWGSNLGVNGRQGTFAEFCCAPEEFVHTIPEGVNDRDAAAASLTGITAHLALFWRTALKAGETAFVNGGTGGVGSMVVQMAKAVGAKVITTAGSDDKVKAAQSLGADRVLNYKTDDLATGVKEFTGGRGVDVWVETQPPTDLDRTISLVSPFGRIVALAGRAARPAFPNGPFYVKCLSLFGFAMFNVPAAIQQTCADEMNWWLADGKIRAVIGTVMNLSEAAAAHRLQEENTIGKAGTLSGKIVLVP